LADFEKAVLDLLLGKMDSRNIQATPVWALFYNMRKQTTCFLPSPQSWMGENTYRRALLLKLVEFLKMKESCF
jgi:hypothetical protein